MLSRLLYRTCRTLPRRLSILPGVGKLEETTSYELIGMAIDESQRDLGYVLSGPAKR